MINVVVSIKLDSKLLKNIVHIHKSIVPSDSLENIIPLRVTQKLKQKNIIYDELHTDIIRKRGIFRDSYVLNICISNIQYDKDRLYHEILYMLQPYFDKIEDFKLYIDNKIYTYKI